MATARLVQIEREHQSRAFEVYYELGPKRSHKAVAEQLGVSVASVKNWSRSFRWRERIAERDAKIARQLASRNFTDEVSRRERSVRIVELALIRLAKSISQGDVRMSLSDLDKLVRLEFFLRDEPDSRQEIILQDLKDKTDEELRDIMRKEFVLLRELTCYEDGEKPSESPIRVNRQGTKNVD
jgi:transposase